MRWEMSDDRIDEPSLLSAICQALDISGPVRSIAFKADTNGLATLVVEYATREAMADVEAMAATLREYRLVGGEDVTPPRLPLGYPFIRRGD